MILKPLSSAKAFLSPPPNYIEYILVSTESLSHEGGNYCWPSLTSLGKSITSRAGSDQRKEGVLGGKRKTPTK